MDEQCPVIHFEMGYQDKIRMTKFYENVFGWVTNSMGPEMGNYVTVQTTQTDENGMVQTPGTINGGFYQKTDDPRSQAPSIVISVTNIDKAVEAVKAAGGQILGATTPDGQHLEGPQMIPGVGLWVSCIDTENNRFSMLQPGDNSQPS